MVSIESVLERNGLSVLIQGHPDNIYVFTLDGTFVDCNDNLVRLTGYSKEELLAITFGPIVKPEYAEMTWQNFARAAQGETVNYVTRGTTKNGDEFIVDVTNLPLHDDDGTPVGVMGIARDIGSARDIEERLERSQVASRIASKLAKFGGWSIEIPSGELYWSDELFALLKVPGEQAPPVEYAVNMYPAPYKEHLEAALDACITRGVPMDLESVIRDGEGREFPVHIVGEAVRNDAGDIIRVQGAFQDISELVADRDEKLALQLRQRETLNQIGDGIYFLDRDWRFTFVNSTGERYIENTADVLLGRSIWDLYPDAWDSTFGVVYREAMEQRVIKTTRGYYPPLKTWFEATVYPTQEGLALYLRDVTADEKVRDDLRAKTARLEEQAELLDSARDAIFVFELDETITYWNRGAERMYGWSSSEAVGTTLSTLLSMNDVVVENAKAAVNRHGHWLGELRQEARDGSLVLAECRWQYVDDGGSEPSAIFAVHTDVTEARKAQENKIRAQRMESLGTLAGGIAHDLNNVLTPILMSVQLLDQQEHDASKRQLLQSIEVGVKRGADMIRQVLSFAQGVEGERHTVSIAALLHELLDFCSSSLPKSVNVVTDIGEPNELWHVEGDSTQILQVLINLITNARDAVGGSGTITIRAANRDIHDDGNVVTHVANPGDYVFIEVEDDGHGMDPDVAARVFEPFFTTKETGSGTGLGLPTSLSIVTSHRGQMKVYSEPGQGTTFQVLLPRSNENATLLSPLPDAAPRGDGQRIMIIDDEAAIRHIVSQTLEAHGYETLTASNGREGIELLESLDPPVDLVLTDMQMPVMDGAATAAYLSQHHPEIVVVAASGLNANGGVARAAHAGTLHFVPKPFTTHTLLSTIAVALSR